MIQRRLSTTLRMLEREIRHTTGAQPTRMMKFHVRKRERTTDGAVSLDLSGKFGLQERLTCHGLFRERSKRFVWLGFRLRPWDAERRRPSIHRSLRAHSLP